VADEQIDDLRPLLVSIAYRITGSRADAEDIAQEAAVRWLKADRSAVRSPRAFLTTIATRLSLNHLRDRKAKREDYPGDWLPEPVDTSVAGNDRLDEISFGFLTLLEKLTPLQRAVFVLRTAFDCDHQEIATIVGREAAACRKIFSRAQAAMKAGRRQPVPAGMHSALLTKFLAAAESGDAGELARLLADDVTMRGDGGRGAPALKKPLTGKHVVAKFIVASRALLPAGTALSIEALNGSPAAIFRVRGRVVLAILIECSRNRVAQVFAIANPEKLNAPGRG
jgi:RNA polymerase sigma-70 factor (ECF subfamily)